MRFGTLVSAAAILLALASAPAHAKKARDVVSAPEPDQKAIIAEIPFEPDSPTHRIYIDLAKEGHRPLVMLLDTGAQGSVMTPRMARGLGVSIRRDRATPYRRGTRLGRDLQFWVDDRSSDTGARTFEYGLLGGHFLEEYVVELDFPRQRVRFINRKKYRLPKSVSAENEAVMRIDIVAKRPMIPIAYGAKKISTLLDTGAPGSVSLSGAAADEIGFAWRDLSDVGKVYGVSGSTAVRITQSSDITIAGFHFPDMPVMIKPRGFFNMGGNTDSITGFDWMKQFVIRIDYRRSRIWLRREVEASEAEWLDWEQVFAGSEAESAEGAPDPDPPRSAEEKQQRRDETAASDQAQQGRWKQDTKTAVYMQGRGGWVRVDGYRRRQGPREGELWVSFEEMQAKKAEQAAQEAP